MRLRRIEGREAGAELIRIPDDEVCCRGYLAEGAYGIILNQHRVVARIPCVENRPRKLPLRQSGRVDLDRFFCPVKKRQYLWRKTCP